MLKQIFISTILITGLITNSAVAQNLDSRAGDEAALEALAGTLEGLGTGWSTNGMSLGNSIEGVSVESINGELRVTKLNLKEMGLTGNIEVPEIGNLKEMTYFNISYNNLVTQIPPELGSCTKLVYLYLNMTNGYEGDNDPHIEATTGSGDVHPGKSRSTNDNHIYGAVPSSLGNLTSLKWFILNWTDTANGVADGISSVPDELFNISSLVGLQIRDNNNVADKPFPAGITSMTNLVNLAIGTEKAGKGTGWLTGTLPSNFTQLKNLKFLRLEENKDLTIDFDQIDVSGMTSLHTWNMSFTDMRGTFPAYVLDGTLPIVSMEWSFPTGDGFTGTLGSGGENVKVLTLYGHDISGSIPDAFWNHTSLINTGFNYNNLTSIGTDDLTRLAEGYWQIRNLRWAHNEIEGRWPTLAWNDANALKDLSRVEFQDNRYVFSDMLWIPDNGGGKTIFDLYNGLGLSKFRYSPQKPFGQSRTISVSSGNDVTIDDFDGVVTHADNAYQWQKGGTNISGATSRSLTIAGAQDSDAGTYRLIVTNPNIPDLTLTSKAITIDVVKDNSTDSPVAPSLISPNDGATGISPSPTLDWESSSGAETYRVQITTSSDFSSLAVDNSGLTSTQYSASGLSNGTTYYWRVNASNSAGSSNWSASRKFSTESSSSTTAPSAPTLNTPDDGATGVSTSPSLDWNSSTNADTYRLQLATTSDFSSLVTDSSGLTSTQYSASELSNGTTYYWKINASNSAGSSNWSSSRSFTTVESPSDNLPAPVQISPNDGASNTAINPTIAWNPVDGADYYVLHVGQPDSAVEVIDVQITDSKYDVPDSEKLEPKALYKWRVHAVKDGVAGEWSSIWEFTTESESTTTVSKTTIFYKQGWNLVSLPRDTSNRKFEELFRDIAQSSIYLYDGQNYIQVTSDTELEPGKGYWIKLLSDQEVVYQGDPISTLNLSLNKGWNLIGGLLSSVDIQSEISDPENVIEDICRPPGSLNSKCQSVTSLEPGKAYFIKISDSGNISLN